MAEKSARYLSRTTLAPGVHVYVFEGQDLSYRAGQFISIRCGESGDVRRSYTLVTPPGRPFEVLVKDVDGGVGTAYLAGLAKGDAIHFTGPMGFFVADDQHAGPAIHVVTGAGIAASLPVLEQIVARGEPAQLFWGQKDGQPTYWHERVTALGIPWSFVTAPDWPAVHEELARRALAAIAPGAVFYTVGNGDMCRRVRDALVAAGVDRRKQIRNEIFYPVVEGQK